MLPNAPYLYQIKAKLMNSVTQKSQLGAHLDGCHKNICKTSANLCRFVHMGTVPGARSGTGQVTIAPH